MFYSIYIDGEKFPKKAVYDDDNYLYDIELRDIDIIFEEYVIPYLKNEEFTYKGKFISRENIETFLIKKTDEKIETITENIEKEMEAEGKFGMAWKSLTFSNDKYAKDVTNEFFKEARNNRMDSSDLRKQVLPQENKIKNKVFIVHGRDEELKEKVARFVEKLGLEAIILQEQANQGRTIIEKFEENSSEIGYAIVLYTPCDKGCLKEENDLKPRARQNVVFEHGYFIGKLGRERVCALVKDEIEIPSDLLGMVYISCSDSWKLMLAAEMKKVGLPIDMNQLF